MPSAALTDPGFASQVAELRRDRRAEPGKKQASRLAFQRVPGLVPPSVEPSPRFIAISAASQIVTASQPDAREKFWAGVGGALVTPSPLRTLNGFLDYLLWVILTKAKSATLSRVRSAVRDTLEAAAADRAIAAADSQLSEHFGDDDMYALGDADENAEATGKILKRNWDVERAWKRARLRCMVYTRLGDMEEEDEQEFLGGEGNAALPMIVDLHDPSNVSPGTAIFLTSVIEFVGEHVLIVSGKAASDRTEAEKNKNEQAQDDFEDSGFEVRPPSVPERLTVLDEDMERLTSDGTVGELWLTWKRALRGSISLWTDLALSSGRRRPRHRQTGSRGGNADTSTIDPDCDVTRTDVDESQAISTAETFNSASGRSRSHTLPEGMSPDSRRETDEAMNRIKQHYRSQSMTSPEAKRRAMVLSARAPGARMPGAGSVGDEHVPSALDTVDINEARSMEADDSSDRLNVSCPILGYCVEGSSQLESPAQDEINDEAMITTAFVARNRNDRGNEDRTLSWLLSPDQQQQSPSAPDSTLIITKSPSTEASTSLSVHRALSKPEARTGRTKPSNVKNITVPKRSIGETALSPVSSIFNHLRSRNLTSRGSTKSRSDVSTPTSSALDQLINQDGTVRKTYQSGPMRDMECRRVVLMNKVPASAARDASVQAVSSTKYLADFIRSTGPVAAQAAAATANGKTKPNARRPPQYEARDAVYDRTENLQELADFIRQGPPANQKQAGQHPCADHRRTRLSLGGAWDTCSEGRRNSVTTRRSETEDASFLTAPDRLYRTSCVDAKANGGITLCEFLSTLPVPEEGVYDASPLPTPLTLGSHDSRAPSIATMSTNADRPVNGGSVKALSMRRSFASLSRRSTFSSSPSMMGEDAPSFVSEAQSRKAKSLLRRRKGLAIDPYRDSPYGERDTPYGAELEKERRCRQEADQLRSRTDASSSPTPSAPGDGWSCDALSGRGYSVSLVASSSKASVAGGVHGGNPPSIELALSPTEEALKRAKVKLIRETGNGTASVGKRQSRTLARIFRKAR